MNTQSQFAPNDGPCSSVAETGNAGRSRDVVCDLLYVAQQIRKLLNERLEPHNLSDVRLAVLKMVRDTETRGGCSQAELAAEIAQSESSVSTLIDRMRADRLLYRLQARSDRRRRRLVLTDEGRLALEAARRDYATIIEAISQILDPEKQVALTELLRHLSAAIARNNLLAAKSANELSCDGMSPAA